jgi:hypothetical protein
MTDERPKDVHETEEVATASTRRRKPWQRSSLFVILFLGLVVVLLRIGFDVWVHVSVPADTPRIAMTFDDSWLSDLGITRATYEQVIARAGGRLLELAPVANTQPADEQRTSKLLANADGLLLTGGGDVDPLLYGGDPGTAQGPVVCDARDSGAGCGTIRGRNRRGDRGRGRRPGLDRRYPVASRVDPT